MLDRNPARLEIHDPAQTGTRAGQGPAIDAENAESPGRGWDGCRVAGEAPASSAYHWNPQCPGNQTRSPRPMRDSIIFGHGALLRLSQVANAEQDQSRGYGGQQAFRG